jgi:flagellar protein FlaG
MDTNAKPVSVGLSPIASVEPIGPAAQGTTRDRAAREAERVAHYRLVIEEGPAKGTFVYKTLNSDTGEVIRQFPREEVVRLSAADTYAKGMVADTKA